MNSSEKSTSKKILFIDYLPADLKETTGNNWRVVFRVRIPGTEKMKIFKRRVPKHSNKTLRKKMAIKMCNEINKKLEKGWSPFFDGIAENEFKTFPSVLKMYIDQAERKAKDGLIRKDSYRAYNSFTNNIRQYLEEKKLTKMFAAQFDKKFVLNFLDYIYYERKRTARTHNNYLSFSTQLVIFMTEV